MSTPRPPWLEPLKDPRNEAILAAAFDIFVEKGFHGATMLDVAKEARVSKETLYARFDSKEGLLFALLAWGCGKAGDECAGVDAMIDEDPAGALTTYVATILRRMTHAESVAVYRVIVSESGRTPAIGRTFNEMGEIGSAPMRARLYKALAARGLIDADDFDEFEDDLFGLVRGNWHHNILMGVAPLPDEAAIAARAERVVKRILRAYAPERLRAANAA
ncbi:MAG: TetR/AcrR family transcriptional regulator [Hydrogenophilaceae bacterium]|jgi:AcrR family transcriptional regulator|nr:TetR/AcrR family transcriptional regulator [Hydrogenophilaceae bacterium]